MYLLLKIKKNYIFYNLKSHLRYGKGFKNTLHFNIKIQFSRFAFLNDLLVCRLLYISNAFTFILNLEYNPF